MPTSPTTSATSRLPYQFRLRTLFAWTLLVGLMCGSARLGLDYVVAAATLTACVLLVRLFVRSPYQTHVRVLATLVAGLLYLAALWLPVSADFELFGWQAAWFYADRAWHIDYASILPNRAWDVANIWIIVLGNLIAWILPPLMIWAPRHQSLPITLLAALAAAQAWSFAIVESGIKFSEGESGYWMWCASLSVLVAARLMPFGWQMAGVGTWESPPSNSAVSD